MYDLRFSRWCEFRQWSSGLLELRSFEMQTQQWWWWQHVPPKCLYTSITLHEGATVAQSVECLTTGWTIRVQSPTGAEDCSSSPCVQTGSGAHPASCTMGTRGPFPRGKVQTGHDADHSPPSSAEVKNEQELYRLSPHAPPWCVARSLYLYNTIWHYILEYYYLNKTLLLG
jgi:hypothetical protein